MSKCHKCGMEHWHLSHGCPESTGDAIENMDEAAIDCDEREGDFPPESNPTWKVILSQPLIRDLERDAGD